MAIAVKRKIMKVPQLCIFSNVNKISLALNWKIGFILNYSNYNTHINMLDINSPAQKSALLNGQ